VFEHGGSAPKNTASIHLPSALGQRKAQSKKLGLFFAKITKNQPSLQKG
jgi:hypothetical protein